MVKTVEQWLSTSSSDDLIECRGSPVRDQLARFDAVGTGAGFVFILLPVESETVEDGDIPVAAIAHAPTQELAMSSQAVFKVRGTWYVVSDDNLSDMACAMLRIIVEQIPKPTHHEYDVNPSPTGA